MKKLVVLFLFIVATPASAKWATYEDASLKTSYQLEINVKNDGKMERVVEVQHEILKEPGREIAANYTLQYNGASTKIKILDAKTIYKGKEYKLDHNLIEDKPLASSYGGFDQLRQILLAFPKVEIGAIISLKYQAITTEVPLPNFYASIFSFGNKEYLAKARVKLSSQIPLHIIVNDPKKVLNITKDAKDNFHHLEITLKKPIYQAVINEPATNVVNDKHLTWVSVSSLKEWKDLATRFSPFYAKVFTQELPKDFIKIFNTAEKKTDEIEQINTVTSLLNDKIQYMGDWKTVKGQLIPRDFDIISKTQLGDCKDFAAATAAILTKLGYNAQVILARRGVGDFYPESLPDLAAFNHALVKATNKQGKVYWIDPTNFQSMADGIFPDIADKMALIIDQKQPGYEKIASINPEHAQVISKRQIKILNDNKIVESGEVTLKNEEAYPLIGITLRISERALKDSLFNSLSNSRLEEKNKKKLHLPNLQSRIVNDISFSYSFEKENAIFKTNLGQALQLNYDTLTSFSDVTQDYVTDILAAGPFTSIRKTVIKNVDVQNIESLNKTIKTPWLYVERKCSLNNHDLQIDDIMIIYKNLIANEELKKPEFIALKNELEKNFKDVAVVFNKRN